MQKFGHVCACPAYRTQQTIQNRAPNNKQQQIRTTKQNKAKLPNRNTTLSLLLKYSLMIPNAPKEKDKDKKKNIYK